MAFLNLFRRGPPDITFVGPKVSLRPPRHKDRRQWIALRQESKEFLEPWEPAWPRDALTPAGYRRRIDRQLDDWRDQSSFAFFIHENRGGKLVGSITVANVRRGVVQSANIGYWTGQPFLRKGYMSEAVQVALDFCFRRLQLHRVEAACLGENMASKSLLLQAGFQPEGLARKYLCIAGRWQDHETFAILRTDPRPQVLVTER